MNYIIENNINFFDELHKELDKNLNCNSPNKSADDKERICLITHQPLELNNITLSCNHTFNYLPLYKEVSNQKTKNYLETMHLCINQIKCPYCRTITNKLLPYIEHKDVVYKKGVNFPSKYCMSLFTCERVIKSGKNKNKLCGREAYESSLGIYCKKCQNKLQNKNKIEISIEWSDKHEQIGKKYKLLNLKQILRENKLKIGGTKKVLVDRVIKNDLV